MGKLIMPKHTGERVYFQTPLKVYYDAKDWVSMRDFADRLFGELVAIGKEHSRNSDNTHYTKCAQLPRYFGLVKRKSAANDADARITPMGIKVYEALVNEDMASVHAALVEAMETMSFGRDNEGCGSDSDVEPLGVFFRCAYALDGLTGKEFGYILGALHEHGKSIGDVQEEVLSFRTRGLPPSVPAQSLASNLADCKTLKLLKELGFIVENTLGRMVVAPAVDAIYHNRLGRLRITNAPPLKKPFKKWLEDNDYGVSIESYPRSIEAISMPLSDPMSKTTGSWEGVYEYVLQELPTKEAFAVSGIIDYLRAYRKFDELLVKGLVPPVDGVDPQRHQELIDYTMLSGNSMDKGRLYCANGAYKKFLRWLSEHKAECGIEYTKEEEMLNKYLAAIRTKPFILLAGISGTGKSRLVRQLAQGCCPTESRLAWEDDAKTKPAKKPGNFEMIQVRPNWHDSTQLIGYESRATGTHEYVIKPFVSFLAKAWKNLDVPFFLCLDEMNLAPVEQYFAEYLSVIETRKVVDGKIVTDPLVRIEDATLFEKVLNKLFEGGAGTYSELIQRFKHEGGIAIPPNLVVMGTVNMDETTFSFSRKVLDRAMSFELNEVDMDGGLEQNPDVPFGSIDTSVASCKFTQGYEVYSVSKENCDKIKTFLVEVNKLLDKTPFKIAYRTRNEIMIYCHERTKNKQVQLAQALDEATSMKILSRVEGDKRRLVVRDEASAYNGKELLESLAEVIQVGLRAIRGGEAEYTESSVCKTKLTEMIGQLQNGYTSFWTR